MHGESRWRTRDEGTFTVEIPSWWHKRKVQPIDSHCGEYVSLRVRFNFDEVDELLYRTDKAKARHDELARAYQASVQDEASPQFIRRIGDRFALFTVEQDQKWEDGGYPGKHAVEVFIPYERGGSLNLWITFRDLSDRETALRIAKSIQSK